MGLAAAAARAGAACCEQSPVKNVRFTRKYADVVTAHGTIRTGHVVIATGSATAEFKPLRRHFKRRESYFAMTEPVPGAVRRQLGDQNVVLTDAQAPAHRIRWAAGDRLMIGGADQDETPERTRPAVLVQRTGQLMYQLLTMYPAISGLQPEFGWDVPYGVPADGLMYIGAHRNYPFHHFAHGRVWQPRRRVRRLPHPAPRVSGQGGESGRGFWLESLMTARRCGRHSGLRPSS